MSVWQKMLRWLGGSDAATPAQVVSDEPTTAPGRPRFSRIPRRAAGVAAKPGIDARAQIMDLHLRGAIFVVTKSDQIVGYDCQALGPVRARGQIAPVAAKAYPTANAVVGLHSLPRQGRKLAELGGMAVLATPRDPAMAAPRYRDEVILIDGSNVMNWAQDAGLDRRPSLAPMQRLLQRLTIRAVVVFDATVGPRLLGREVGTAELAALLAAEVIIAPRGQPADQVLIALARRDGAVIISNDHFRDDPLARHLLKQKGYATVAGITLLPPRP